MGSHHAEGVQSSGRGTSASGGLLVHGLRVVAGVGLILSCAGLTPDSDQDLRATAAAASTMEAEEGDPEAAPRPDSRVAAARPSPGVAATVYAALSQCDGAACSLDGSIYGSISDGADIAPAVTRTSTAEQMRDEDRQAPKVTVAAHGSAAGGVTTGSVPDARPASLALAAPAGSGYPRSESSRAGMPWTTPGAAAPEASVRPLVALNQTDGSPQPAPTSAVPTSAAPVVAQSTPTAMKPEPNGLAQIAALNPGAQGATHPVPRRAAPLTRGIDTSKGTGTPTSTEPRDGVDTPQGAEALQAIDTAPHGNNTPSGDNAPSGNDTPKAIDALMTPDERAPRSSTPSVTPSLSPSGLPEILAALPGSSLTAPSEAGSQPGLQALPTRLADDLPGLAHPDLPGALPPARPMWTGLPNLVERLAAEAPGSTVGCCDPRPGGASPPVNGNGPVDLLFHGPDRPLDQIADPAHSPNAPTAFSFLEPVTDAALSTPTALLAAVVPEPSTLALLGVALWGLAASSRSRRNRTDHSLSGFV